MRWMNNYPEIWKNIHNMILYMEDGEIEKKGARPMRTCDMATESDHHRIEYYWNWAPFPNGENGNWIDVVYTMRRRIMITLTAGRGIVPAYLRGSFRFLAFLHLPDRINNSISKIRSSLRNIQFNVVYSWQFYFILSTGLFRCSRLY